VLEAACAAGIDTTRLRCLGFGDAFVEHGERDELLASLGLNAEGIAASLKALLNASAESFGDRADHASAVARFDARHPA
jgi:deoxyxylulose-5-phosphate synthase